jgi:hypothetical protein
VGFAAFMKHADVAGRQKKTAGCLVGGFCEIWFASDARYPFSACGLEK